MSKEQNQEKKISRRAFLWGGVLLSGSMLMVPVSCAPGHRMVAKSAAEWKATNKIKEKDPLFWFELKEGNRVVMWMPKCEMGQGIFTGLAMLAAEELEVDYHQIDVVPSTTQKLLDTTGTGGSQTTVELYQPIREVAAKMRLMLIKAAANHWNVDESEIEAENGMLTHKEQSISYFELSKLVKKWEQPGEVKLKPSSEFKYVGKDFKRNDLLPKVVGSAIYSIDKEFPEMLHGIFVKSPYLQATAGNVDASEAEKVNGFVKLIRENDFIAVVAKSRYAAEMAARKVKVEWKAEKQWTQEDILNLVQVGVGKKREIMLKGNVFPVLKNEEGKSFEIAYRMSTAAHAHMEPNGTIASFKDGAVTLISGLQALPRFQEEVANRLGIKTEQVVIKNSFLGGGFGRRTFNLDLAWTARVSQVLGKPVHMLNDRTQEFQNGYLRPPTHHVFKAKMDKDGRLIAVDYQFASADMLLNFLPDSAQFFMGSDPAASHGARIHYDIKGINVSVWRQNLPFQTGFWRGVGMVPNAWAIESFMDEMAVHTKTDPIEFRLKHFTDTDSKHLRFKTMFKHLLDKGYWARAKRENIGRGFACAEDRGTLAASIIEVSIKNGKIKVERIVTAIDPVKIINPEGVRQQVEGCAVMGLSSALYEDIEVVDNQLAATNFHEYQLPLMKDVPEIETVLLESGNEPTGVGEPPIAPIAPAIANAIFDLTGKRLRELPLQKAYEKEA